MDKNKILILARQKEKVFHTSDLKTLWGITNQNTLHVTIHRYLKKKILFSLHKGYYGLLPPDQIDHFTLGFKAIKNYCYVSTESIMSISGIINQIPSKVTLISSRSFSFEIGDNYYKVRQLYDKALYNPIGIKQNDEGVLLADNERAVADMLHYQDKYYFDGDLLINWNLVRKYQKELGYQISKKY